MADRRQTVRPDSTDRRRPGPHQFGRGTGEFAETVNRTFEILRRIAAQQQDALNPEEAE